MPTPNQPGMPWRLCVHENTHGIARSASSVSFAPPREAGREPIGRCATSSIGVAATRVAREPILVGGEREIGAARGVGGVRQVRFVVAIGVARGSAAAASTAPTVSSRSRSAISGSDVARGHRLALLGHAHAAADRLGRLRADRLARRATAATERAAAAVEDREQRARRAATAASACCARRSAIADAT